MLRLTTAAAVLRLSPKQSTSPAPLQLLVYGQRQQCRLLTQRTGNAAQKTYAPYMAKGGMNKKITTTSWLLLLLPATAFGLGCWQVKRLAWKKQLIRELEELTKTAPVPLPENLAELQQMEYRLVRVRGKFLHDKEMLMGPRSFIQPDGSESVGGLFSQRDGGSGYLIITPFQLANSDDIILVNRGWVSRQHVKPEQRIAGQPMGELELTGVVRKGEIRPQFTPEHKGDVFLYRDLPRMCAETGAKPIFIDADYASTVHGGPIGGQTRVALRNEHFSYLVTWFSLSACTAYLWYVNVLKRIP